ncbi:MAG: hypothetical protein JWM38_1813, partial [Sphingomonas bacterium]|nr:hypothetical protein [Sphingomonas bacterium]
MIAALIAILGGVSPAAAHLMPNSAIYLDFASEAVTAELLIPLNELQYGSGIKVRTDSAGFAADRPRLAGYVARHIGV